MSTSNCCFLTCIQDSQETGKVVWYSHLFKNFLQFLVIHTVKGFSIVSEADVCSGIPSLSLLSNECWQFDLLFLCLLCIQLGIWKFSVHVLLKTSLNDFEHDLAGMWNEDNCTLLWTFFGTALLWYWNENWPFSVLWSLWNSRLSSILSLLLQSLFSKREGRSFLRVTALEYSFPILPIYLN